MILFRAGLTKNRTLVPNEGANLPLRMEIPYPLFPKKESSEISLPTFPEVTPFRVLHEEFCKVEGLFEKKKKNG